MEQLNRGQLLDKAFKGEIKTGDKFKRVSTGCMIVFEGEHFRWAKSRDIVQMSTSCGKLEVFEKHEEKIKLELTQDEVNTLALLIARTSQAEREDMFDLHSKTSTRITSICAGGAAHSLFTNLYRIAK
ncbi:MULTISPECIES: hypothetical protein [Bacillus cereus group]|uniref:hypothetical protein n=1 Tax=Bacillus cereus group TaxID=86661 RepID=UPI0011A37DE4|nr:MULTISPECIES: hypothetical protein [Bacillus cereus group]MDF9638814.1 hypothetical protein [Bacillus cereus]